MAVVAAVIFNVVPFPDGVPPHETEYHCQVAPVPRVPPCNVSVEALPSQIVSEAAVMVVADMDKSWLFITILPQLE